MDDSGFLRELDGFEDGLIEDFKRHPVLVHVPLLSDDDFATLLLQRRFLSLAFTPAYDLAIDLLTDESGLRIARTILREEYPGSHGRTRSHREDMKEDLLQLGVTRQALVEARPTGATTAAVTGTLELIADAGRAEHADLRLLTILRFWGEILVSLEYGRFWPRMEGRLTHNGKNQSYFYYPHLVHDAKAHPLATTSRLSASHSDRLGVRLSELLARDGDTDGFRQVEQRAYQLRVDFYDQFLPMARQPEEASPSLTP
ncbi:hypothetical protein [Nonomuraea jiangxiensis]|uniref:Uncharacterized protein n=1 Tax=Nonomuraea jiangxiensis TaxID=633440 RepID=A0A1G8RUB3_9ACTN|nr:hypothetical protein [Nonomuraea jiangxiensis]SDJ20591.1 hypothetical protein SAMN05421869_109187 [Nonomuraea jiangxiensis]